MKLDIFSLLLILILSGFVSDGQAGERFNGPGSEPPSLTVAEANTILSGLGVEIKEVRKAPVSGMWELVMEKSGERTVAYLDSEKKYLMPGPIFEIATGTLVGAGQKRPLQPNRADVSAIPLTGSIIMGNPQGKKKLFVFTDPDCPYSAKLHWELVRLRYMEPDLAIYVKMFPLKMHPKAYDKARVILGANSSNMLDKAFAGETLPPPGPNDPAKPVDDSIKLAESLGINSTPTLVLPDGRIVPGSKSAVEIKVMLNQP